MDASEDGRMRVLMATAEAMDGAWIQATGHDIEVVGDLDALAARLAAPGAPAVVLVDAGADAAPLLARLPALRAALGDRPGWLLVRASAGDPEGPDRLPDLLRAGADDVLRGPLDPGAVALRLAVAERAVAERWELQRMRYLARNPALTDPRTGAVLPQVVLLQVEQALLRGERSGDAVTLLVMEPDAADALAARRGPAAAREVARELAVRVRDSLRDYDVVGVAEGRTVMAALYPCSADDAPRVAMRLQVLVGSRPAAVDGEQVHLRCSVGLATWTPGGPPVSASQLVDRAGMALARARMAGGNRVEVARAPEGQRRAG